MTGDSDLSVCVAVEMDDDNWDTRFLEELGKDQDSREEVAIIDRDSDDEDDTADQEELSKLKNYKEAVVALEEVSRFLELRGHGEEASLVHR